MSFYESLLVFCLTAINTFLSITTYSHSMAIQDIKHDYITFSNIH